VRCPAIPIKGGERSSAWKCELFRYGGCGIRIAALLTKPLYYPYFLTIIVPLLKNEWVHLKFWPAPVH
jgi:hypothetical protein